MITLPDVTLLCIDTANHVLARNAVVFTAAQCRFATVVYLSDQDWKLDGARFHQIPPITAITDYNRLMIKHIGTLIETSHALVIQYDGFVANPQRWTDAFLDFDYIGAPWPLPAGFDVGNGGFSLRSRRLLDALRDPAIPVLPSAEDALICQSFRQHLETRSGIRFADRKTAARFSFEQMPPPPQGTFGFHGLINAARSYGTEGGLFFAQNLDRYVYANPGTARLPLYFQRIGADVAARMALTRFEAEHDTNQLVAIFAGYQTDWRAFRANLGLSG